MTENETPLISPPDALPELLPILPLFDAVLFPKMVLPLMVVQEESIKLVDDVMAKDRVLGLVASTQGGDSKPERVKETLSSVGTGALILKMANTNDNRTQLLVQGLSRFRIRSFADGKAFLEARVTALPDVGEKDNETEALMANVVSQFGRIVELSPGLPQEIGQMARSITLIPRRLASWMTDWRVMPSRKQSGVGV